jgi:D-glycero-alpha-D-manno-heptose 1-phosphate guanylyltransferase
MSELAIGDIAAVILVGGLGTRLRNVLAGSPKPMALINGRPFLEILVAQVARAGIRDLVLCVGYRAETIEAHFGDGSGYGIRIRYAREQELLGTAGAVCNALGLVGSDPFLVLNGDSYCSLDFSRLAAHHRSRRAAATIVAVESADCSRYGRLQLNPDGAVEGFIEKNQASGPGWINAGIYLLRQAVLKPLTPGKPASMERDVFPGLAARHSLQSVKTSGTFIDIGIPSELERAQTLFAASDFHLAK